MPLIQAGSPGTGTARRLVRQSGWIGCSNRGNGSPRGPGRSRPGGGPARCRGTGVVMSVAPHVRRPVTAATTVALALLAAAITAWLALMAHLGAAAGGDSPTAQVGVPDRLAVVWVEPGETLQHLAARVAPGAPVGQVAGRIRELNALDSSVLVAGQTLIAPVG